MEEVLPELKEFIAGYCDKYRITKVDPDMLTVDTSIDLDLDIFDIEIDLFLAEFASRFTANCGTQGTDQILICFDQKSCHNK